MKKIINLIRYILLIRNNRQVLMKKHKLRVNWLYQLYTVISLPPERHKNAIEFGVNGYPYLDEEVERYMKDLDRTFMETGLFEIVGIKELVKVDELNVRLMITYSQLNVEKVFRNVILLILLLMISGIIFLIKY